MMHVGHEDINDNCRWAAAHIPAVARINVEGVNIYNLLKHHKLIMTEAALQKLIHEIQTYPAKRKWGQRFATPDGKPAPVPEKVPGWNDAWVERKKRLINAEFRAKEFFRESLKWKWSPSLKGPLKIPETDPLFRFKVKDFVTTPERPIWEKLESIYADDEPLEEEIDVDEFDDLMESMDQEQTRHVRMSAEIEDPAEVRMRSLRSLARGGRAEEVS